MRSYHLPQKEIGRINKATVALLCGYNYLALASWKICNIEYNSMIVNCSDILRTMAEQQLLPHFICLLHLTSSIKRTFIERVHMWYIVSDTACHWFS